MQTQINIGDTLKCAETGKTFIAARDGCSFNYAMRNGGEIVSDEGVNLCERRALLNRAEPFYGYISGDGKHLTGWKSNILGDVVSRKSCRLSRFSYVHGKSYSTFRIRDVHGSEWTGRGSPGISIKIRAVKS